MTNSSSFSLVTQDTVQQALSNLNASKQLINRSYLAQLEQNAVMPYAHSASSFSAAGDVRVFRLERIVQSNKQAVLESLTAAYTALGAAGYTVFLYLNSNGQETDVFIGTRGEPGRMEGQNSGALLYETFRGHFAGSSLKPLDGVQVRKLLDDLEQTKQLPTTSVTAVTGVPALSTENRDHFMQGLERFIDAAEQRIYQALILAEPVSPSNLDVIKEGYEQVATQLSPLLKTQLSYGEQDSESIGATLTSNLSESLGKSLALTETKGTTHTEGTSSTHTKGTSESSSASTGASKTATIAGSAISVASRMGVVLKRAGHMGAGVLTPIGGVIGGAIGTAFGNQHTSGTTESQSKGTSSSDGTSYSTSKASTDTSTYTRGTSDAHSRNRTTGQTRQHSLEIVDKGVEQLLEKISHHLKRINEAKTYGGWNAAAYFVSDSSASSETLASIFLGLIRGENSSTEDFALSTWKSSAKSTVLEWLSRLTHPQLKSNFSRHVPIEYLTPATLVTGKEMAIQLSLPRRSTSTVAVVETQAFGRKVQSLNEQSDKNSDRKTIELGQLRHLWENLQQKIKLDLSQISSHVFISGSTGAGKSNTLYEILHQVDQAGIPFMVIEPAKGEYKHIFGNRNNVQVFGTNPAHTALLKINPFCFPKGIHILEHIDRLVEIFNVCWPMYAAMPAVLKESILEAYQQCGWDLNSSKNQYHQELFPTFIDLLLALENVIEKSSYSQELKSNYIGALSTRVKSLTNGLNGQIFSADELDSNTLFNSNVIIDLSRVGSSETKSLIMGILIMRLSEYRMAEGLMNQPLRHVTVLEEAHNILRRNSTESGAEGSSLIGKSVEMLANAIAEMRTYGEGFIIADQSPHAVDVAAIRNTNTKIILRLPEETDRRLIGKSIALRDDQLEEIARLPKGVAIVYQNDWLEPVLCQVKKYENDQNYYIYQPNSTASAEREIFIFHALNLLLNKRINKPIEPDLKTLESGLCNLPLLAKSKIALFDAIAQKNKGINLTHWNSNAFPSTAQLVVDILGCRQSIYYIIATATDYSDLHSSLDALIKTHVHQACPELILATQQCFMKDYSLASEKNLQIYSAWRKNLETRNIQ